ncbi:MAG TPA: TadE/TadG family type IV pilus assembly protein [Ktedonobacterales bacterium]|jgi:Flp pilus assembly protein TadG
MTKRHTWSALTRRTPRLGRSEDGHEDGQALIEFALVVTFLLFLLVGVTDLAGLLDAHLNVIYAARQGARTGAVLGNKVDADCAIVGAIQSTLANQPNFTLNKITVFQVDHSTDQPTGLQDVYAGNAQCDASMATITPGATSATWLPNDPAKPPARNTTEFQEDYIGVTLDYSYTWQFDLFGSGSFQSTDTVIFPLDAQVVPTVPKGQGG